MSNQEEPVNEDGLTESEAEYMTTPFSQMTIEQRLAAFQIRDKRDRFRQAEREDRRSKEQADERDAA